MFRILFPLVKRKHSAADNVCYKPYSVARRVLPRLDSNEIPSTAQQFLLVVSIGSFCAKHSRRVRCVYDKLITAHIGRPTGRPEASGDREVEQTPNKSMQTIFSYSRDQSRESARKSRSHEGKPELIAAAV